MHPMMHPITKATILTLTALVLLSVPTHTLAQAADVAKGAKVYRKCVSCHMIGDKAKNRVGPQLNGIIGRAIAGVDGYRYSKALVKYAAEHKVWSEDNLAAYLKKPSQEVKGGRMAFAGLRKQTDLDNVIAYLKENAK